MDARQIHESWTKTLHRLQIVNIQLQATEWWHELAKKSTDSFRLEVNWLFYLCLSAAFLPPRTAFLNSNLLSSNWQLLRIQVSQSFSSSVRVANRWKLLGIVQAFTSINWCKLNEAACPRVVDLCVDLERDRMETESILATIIFTRNAHQSPDIGI